MCKILILNGAGRPNGFTSHMTAAFTKEARQQGHEVTEFFLDKMTLHGCRCCYQGGRSPEYPCSIRDDMGKIYPVFRRADVIVLASPLYYWSISGQLKIALDRLFALAEEKKEQLFTPKKAGLLMVAAGGGHPEAVCQYFDYLMSRLQWKNLGKVLLLHTDQRNVEELEQYEDAQKAAHKMQIS